jgi:hypothetical protein
MTTGMRARTTLGQDAPPDVRRVAAVRQDRTLRLDQAAEVQRATLVGTDGLDDLLHRPRLDR